MTPLEIGKTDEREVELWVEQNLDLFDHLSGGAEKTEGFIETAAVVHTVLAFLNAVVLVDKYAGGLSGLFKKATAMLQWFKTKKATKLTLRERILVVVFKLGTGKNSSVSDDSICQFLGVAQEEVEDELAELCRMRILFEVERHRYTILST